MRVAGAVVVIAVLDGGSGADLARRFSAAGAAGLLIADLRPGIAEDLAAELDRPGCPVVGVSGDVHHPADLAALVDTAVKHLGPIDLFAVAGPDGERIVQLADLPGHLDPLAELLTLVGEAIGEVVPPQRRPVADVPLAG
ncbi:SDR family NAD(P)-dependent oxidoreductase [Kitasatospora sp. YST-16]|uniref:SDR family NAD(P)-dependent oxidoreductase n=1 Tax=unclassified Kitasatospora TaxID=2633591 RepID=UPI0009DEC9B8|nr:MULTISPECIES: SDR family NAD(P)-dependent oxidoreductase [unclassified Kitasatospora]WAL73558.1 SDR family NAD(P)-dependent oxidoreductase [Kitasatospora sp. YST-16]WNW39614.1 SDR family NAD(P)-dependent oxidoreductase [Streptomyces sp. Li-HN-5-13]